MLTREMRYLGLQSLLLLGWVCLACSNLQSIHRMLFCGIPWMLENKCFHLLGRGRSWIWVFFLLCYSCLYTLCFSYRCPKMRNFIWMALVLRMKHYVNYWIETGSLRQLIHFYIFPLMWLFSCSLGEQRNCAVVTQWLSGFTSEAVLSLFVACEGQWSTLSSLPAKPDREGKDLADRIMLLGRLESLLVPTLCWNWIQGVCIKSSRTLFFRGQQLD